MRKVFIVHGFRGSPNGGWRPWLMAELQKKDVYACALSMPNPESPVLKEWVEEVDRHIEKNPHDDIYLVGHSLGVTTILRYLQKTKTKNIKGVVLVSGPVEKVKNKRTIETFLDEPFDFEIIKSKVREFVIIHGDNDQNVPFSHAEILSQVLSAKLITVEGGGHLNGSSGWTSLPQCLEVLIRMM